MGHNSNSNFDEVIVENISLDWYVDFEKKSIIGSAIYDLNVLKDTDKIIFDGESTNIEEIIFNDKYCEFSFEEMGNFGQKITIASGELKAGTKIKLRIKYETSKTASALQFVDAELTGDKKQPFLFSQCETVHCRSIVPCMDTPKVKQTYEAKVRVPDGIVCLMSGLSQGESILLGDGSRQFFYKQPIPIPSYLIAIVAGFLAKRDISERCAVWAEPSIVDKAQWEFEDTEKMLKVGEELGGDYVWTRYDLVVMPPFFPYGGMENPCLTFVTPTLISGDKSLNTVIAHEISHSWTGNLVTNASWEHFWLNEGFTRFLEWKIIAKLYGESKRQFNLLTSWKNLLLPTIFEIYNADHELTKLLPNISNCEPDEFVNCIPYEKGSAFLLYIEQQIGDVDEMNKFLRAYISKFAKKSILTSDWKEFLFEFFVNKREILDKIDFDKWLYEPGVPPNTPIFDESLLKECENLANVWCEGTLEEINGLSGEDFFQMSFEQKVCTLETIGIKDKYPHNKVELMNTKYGLNDCGNCEVLVAWIQLALKSKWTPIIEMALKFVTQIGRIKYIKPIYKKLFEWDESREKALETFHKNRPIMHPITINVINTLIKNIQE